MQLRFHHIGIACDSIDLAAEWLSNLFVIKNKTAIVHVPTQKVDACMVECEDGTQIELISGETVERYVKKRQYLYHTCWQVEDIESAVDEFIEKGCVLVSSAKSSALFQGRQVAFLFGPLGMIELLEK